MNSIAPANLLDRARQAGYLAFLAGRHYSANPFLETDWQRHDAWDEGWAAAESDHPGIFNFASDSFGE